MMNSVAEPGQDLDRPRRKAAVLIRKSLDEGLWLKNEEFVNELKNKIHHHSIVDHPAISALTEGRFTLQQIRLIHLEYRHAIVQVFTDALLAAQMETRQLEPRLPPGSKMLARFLLTLNILDEFGFRPGLDVDGYYRGTPTQAHYPLFEEVIGALGIGAAEVGSYRPSPEAAQTREFLEASFGDNLLVSALLAVAEHEVVLFSPPLRRNTAKCGIDVGRGYYHVHGTSMDEEAEAADDDHGNDLWLIVTQALLPSRYEEVTVAALQYCDLWTRFWDRQMRLLDQDMPGPAA
jgi:hypothetical protein